MGDIGSHHFKSYLLLSHYFKPNKTIIRANSESNNHSFIITTGFWVSLVFILVFEGFVYLFGDRLTVENQAFSDGRL